MTCNFRENHKRYLKLNPWAKHHSLARERCKPYRPYGKRGIKFCLTMEEIKSLWLRCRADLMEQPSIDRINSCGDYTFKNCRFIEMEENRQRTAKAVLQYTLDGVLIRRYKTLTQASRKTGIDICSISKCARGIRYKTAGGYKWILAKAIHERLGGV